MSKTPLGANIASLRKLIGLTQTQLADKLNIKKSRLGALEEGRAKPSNSFLVKLAKQFEQLSITF